ncbi:uncharacterized protein PHALS_14835 [Plasmopara halstedii]|uniref:Uncharacterized protein n=1 Tax=Plasmopara halstedii TaxID=4781 RepID=A0A0P1AW92_PLAHL|nr:uncharacterized protein PHALS_14835 [Plasmopara halstedii]CEG45735.1 hypothetical protein PHALS_14835 [Plasmopara halstedii]|eukprot:XP_024582104.1 hypothetical protein PHALS_14835 [Plasmopara halstedii]
MALVSNISQHALVENFISVLMTISEHLSNQTNFPSQSINQKNATILILETLLNILPPGEYKISLEQT